MEAYLDNSATTRVCDEALAAATDAMQGEYGNPSSLHGRGYRAQLLVDEARETFAGIWRCRSKEVYFTSGGTESDNLAILGAAGAMARRGSHLITTAVEHPAVYEAFRHLEKQGFEVTYLGTDSEGVISLSELKEALRGDTVLVSVMHVNNETGAIQPVAEAAELIKKENPDCLFHVDDIQGFMKLPLYPGRSGIDLLSVSGHKMHAPKGVGALYVRDGVRLAPVIFGGGQQGGLRSGTENTPGIAAMAAAAKALAGDALGGDTSVRLYGLRREMVMKLSATPGLSVNGAGNAACYEAGSADTTRFAPHIISLAMQGVRAEVMLHALEEEGVYVSAGSACSSHKRAPSRSLSAIGLEKGLLESVIRLSFSSFTTKEETEYAAEALIRLYGQLSRFR